MRKFLLLLLCSAFQLMVFAQNDIPVKALPSQIFRTVKKDPKDTLSWSWKRGGIASLNLSQGSLSNWAAGGDKFSLAITAYFNYYLLHKTAKGNWDNNVDFNFGFIKTSSLGSRKNDDRLDILSKYGIKIDSSNTWYLSWLFNFRSQFFDGYTYNSNEGIFSSSFLSPAYMLLSIGFDYRPVDNFSLFISPVTLRTTIISNDRLAMKALYGVDSGHHFENQIGAFASVNYSQAFSKNVNYKGKLDLFSDYGHNPQNVDVYMTNLFNFKINRFLAVAYSLDLIYDDDVKLFGPNNNSPGLQLKSMIGIGFTMPFAKVILK